MLLCYQRGRGIFYITRDAWTSGWLGRSRMCILINPCIWPLLCLSYLPVQADHAEQDQAGAGGLRGGECQTAPWISNTFCYRSRKTRSFIKFRFKCMFLKKKKRSNLQAGVKWNSNTVKYFMFFFCFIFNLSSSLRVTFNPLRCSTRRYLLSNRRT